jgi:hypothetical protein
MPESAPLWFVVGALAMTVAWETELVGAVGGDELARAKLKVILPETVERL